MTTIILAVMLLTAVAGPPLYRLSRPWREQPPTALIIALWVLLIVVWYVPLGVVLLLAGHGGPDTAFDAVGNRVIYVYLAICTAGAAAHCMVERRRRPARASFAQRPAPPYHHG